MQSFSPMTAIFITPLFFGVGESPVPPQAGKTLKTFSFSTSPSYDRAASVGHGEENSDNNLVLPVLLHVDLRHLLGVPVRPHRALRGALHCPRFLQSHGISGHSRSHSTKGAEALHFCYHLRPRAGQLDPAAADDDRPLVVFQRTVLDQQHKPVVNLRARRTNEHRSCAWNCHRGHLEDIWSRTTHPYLKKLSTPLRKSFEELRRSR